MKRNTDMKIGTILLLMTGCLVCFVFEEALAQKGTAEEQKELLREKAKKGAEEEAMKMKEERIRQEQIEEERARQEILRKQEKIMETFERNRFADVTVVLNKSEYAVGEKIIPEFSIRNGSNRNFYIDGRKFYPKLEVWDTKKNQVRIPQPDQERVPPKQEDLFLLEPGEAFVPLPADFVIEKPGSYTLRLVYALQAPEEEKKGVWFGTIKSYKVHFRVVKKKSKR